MIKKRADRTVEHRSNMRGGEGTITIRHYFAGNDITARCRLCAEVTIPPGGSIGTHEHANEDEVYIIQHGRGVITDNGVEEEVVAGDAVITGKGASHAIRNTGEDNLILTAIIMQYT